MATGRRHLGFLLCFVSILSSSCGRRSTPALSSPPLDQAQQDFREDPVPPLYQDTFGRPPTPEEYLGNADKAEQDLTKFGKELRDSAEYVGRSGELINGLFRTKWDRLPTEEEGEYWAGQLDNGIPLTDVAFGLQEQIGDPAAAITESCYNSIGARHPKYFQSVFGAQRLNTYCQLVQNGQATLDDVHQTITRREKRIVGGAIVSGLIRHKHGLPAGASARRQRIAQVLGGIRRPGGRLRQK